METLYIEVEDILEAVREIEELTLGWGMKSEIVGDFKMQVKVTGTAEQFWKIAFWCGANKYYDCNIYNEMLTMDNVEYLKPVA